MAIDLPLLLIVITLFCSTFVRVAFGFGDALIAMPVLVLIVGLKTAAPLVAIIAFVISISVLLKDWRSLNFKSFWQLTLSGLIGIPIGLYFLKGDYEAWMNGILALVIIGISLYNLLQPTLMTLRTERYVYGFGLLSGILCGAYNAGGVPVVIYGAMKQWSPSTFRATIQGYSIILVGTVLVGHYFADLWTPSVFRLLTFAFPLVCLAIFMGMLSHRFIPQGRFNRYIYYLLLAIGSYLLLQTIS